MFFRIFKKYRQLLIKLGLGITTTFLLIFTTFFPLNANPNLQVHPLPPSLENWQDPQQLGDYFPAIQPTKVGYLIWSEFPIKIYFESPTDTDNNSASFQRFQAWVNAVETAIQEWNRYLPLEIVKQPELADIIIKHQQVPIQAKINPETGLLDIPRASHAQTRYQFYQRLVAANASILAQRMTIYLSPNQSYHHTLGTIRHELGHALGIWGHSSVETDALYVSQVSHPASISVRDINTLKKIYQQPTQLGWKN
jgi:predicted Zn-dependent protease